MKKMVFSLLLSLFFINGIPQVPAVNFEQLEPRLSTTSDSLYVVNFWATWCVPCIKELPEFEKINELYQDKKVKVLLVSLDNPRHLESRLLPFIAEHGLKSEIVLLDDPRSNRWIPLVDDSWSGAIPATIIFTRDSRAFYQQTFTYEELESAVNTMLE
jgi:thiol-disulfide isomerase/thioredoxin